MNIRNEQGFTLVETLVAIFIFVIGVAALTSMLLTTIKGNSIGNQETVAATLANDKLEELRGIDASNFNSDPRLTPGPHLVGRIDNLRTALAGVSGGYVLSYTVTPVPRLSGALFYGDMKQVDVTVTWGQPAHTVRITTFLVPNL